MDLGVGSFVFSQGTVSLRKHTTSFWTTLKRCAPMLLLGLTRVALVKGTEYPEHVTEYGVHWNFFITMGLLLPVTDYVQLMCPQWHWGVVGIVISLLHEYALRGTSLGAWAISEHRDHSNWLSLNKEGITSLPGT